MRTKIKGLLAQDHAEVVGKEFEIEGWIKTVRSQKTNTFVEINDGSCFTNLQVVVDSTLPNYDKIAAGLATGVAVEVVGKVVESPGQNQNIEMHPSKVEIVGTINPDSYPLQKKRHSFEFLRTIAHLRPRTNTFGAVARVRNAAAMATHLFFQQRGFLYVHTPIITASDCEGAGAMFQVTTLDMLKPPVVDGKIDYSQDFFSKPAYLTVSGQLNGETYACALSDVYTFGPTFRAENSNTSRHLAEFWMIEPEMAFADINDDMECAESYIKFVLKYVMEHCQDDMAFFNQYIEPGIIERLQKVAETPFERSTYTYAIRVLQKSGKTFQYPVEWGLDLQSEHERYLTEEFFNKPVILTDYPRKIKAFYMRDNDDGKTVACMDVLVPKIGEIIGGSQREERLDVLENKLREFNLPLEAYQWYLDLRRHGSVPHAGFGLGFERLLQFITGLDNIRDVIPFPRFPGNAEF
ncbi:MAG: asparagine--tRNA ligase [Verrucomicrobia bacterium]|nr:asparagine--tRNA ligase [Verrucomicrobiota bacterium]MBS0636890.1 asparagine--tRNA ligase [Verrucomicrobiota bacterium]